MRVVSPSYTLKAFSAFYLWPFTDHSPLEALKNFNFSKTKELLNMEEMKFELCMARYVRERKINNLNLGRLVSLDPKSSSFMS